MLPATALLTFLVAATRVEAPDAGLASSATPAEVVPTAIAVLVEYNPWRMVEGTDTPRFALYSDGTVIYLSASKSGRRYVSAKLGPEEFRSLRERLALDDRFESLKEHYDIQPNVTDLPTVQIYLRDGERDHSVRVYGVVSADSPLLAYTVMPEGTKADTLPPRFAELHKTMREFAHKKAKPWVADWIEVYIWPYEYAPDKSLVWPAEWPQLDDARSIHWGDGNYSLFMRWSQMGELERFLSRQKERGAILIGGRKWALMWWFVFPGRENWMSGG